MQLPEEPWKKIFKARSGERRAPLPAASDDLELQSLRLGLSIVSHAGESLQRDSVVFEIACLLILFTDLCLHDPQGPGSRDILSRTVNAVLSLFEKRGQWQEVEEILALKKDFFGEEGPTASASRFVPQDLKV